MMPTWTADDLRIVGDIMLAWILRGLMLIMIETYVKPAAIEIGRWKARRIEDATGQELPEWLEHKQISELPDR